MHTYVCISKTLLVAVLSRNKTESEKISQRTSERVSVEEVNKKMTTNDDHHHNHQLKNLHSKRDAYYAQVRKNIIWAHFIKYVGRYFLQGYLNTWCDRVRVEWTKFLHRAFNDIVPKRGGSLLDVGCGPSISNVISASAHFDTIIMADFLQVCRCNLKFAGMLMYAFAE